MGLLAIHIPSLVMYEYKSNAYYLILLFVLFLSHRSSLHILDTGPLSDVQMYFPVYVLIFHFINAVC